MGPAVHTAVRVSAPLRWDEVADCNPADFTLATMPARFASMGDCHAGIDDSPCSLDALLVPSIGLESFGLAAREAMARGVPVIATRDGALTVLFDGGGGGAFFPSGDAAALRSILLDVIARPALLDQWSAEIAPPQTVAAHALEIEEIYAQLLAARQ